MDEKTKQEKINDMADKIKFVFDVLGTKSDIKVAVPPCGFPTDRLHILAFIPPP